MEPGWWGIVVDVAGGPVLLDLVEAIQRYVEPVAPLVLDHCDLDRRLAMEDSRHAAVDADPVVEVDHIVARLERSDLLERSPRHVLPRAADPALATEDLVVGEDPEAVGRTARRDQESAAEDADHQCRRRATFPARVEQLLESLGLSCIVAEDDRRRAVADHRREAGHVAFHRFGCA